MVWEKEDKSKHWSSDMHSEWEYVSTGIDKIEVISRSDEYAAAPDPVWMYAKCGDDETGFNEIIFVVTPPNFQLFCQYAAGCFEYQHSSRLGLKQQWAGRNIWLLEEQYFLVFMLTPPSSFLPPYLSLVLWFLSSPLFSSSLLLGKHLVHVSYWKESNNLLVIGLPAER